MRTTRFHLSTGLVLGAFVLAACGGGDDTGAAVDSPAAATPPATTPSTTASSAVTSIDVGKSIDADKRVTSATTTFAPRDTMYVSVTTQNAPANAMLTAKWTFQDGQVVDTQEKVVPAGPQVTDFSITKPDGWPAGNYTLQVSKDGMVLQTREFKVG